MYHTRVSLFLGIALAAALFATPTAAIEFVGKVVGVTDGDTITVLQRLVEYLLREGFSCHGRLVAAHHLRAPQRSFLKHK